VHQLEQASPQVEVENYERYLELVGAGKMTVRIV
jgi:hypothetical protein